MNNKEQVAKFLEENKLLIEELAQELLGKINYDKQQGIHLLNETGEVFTKKMLDKEIGQKFEEYNDFSYRKKWMVNNKIYFMLLPEDERQRRLTEHKKKVNKMRIANLDKKRKLREEKKDR